MRTKEQIQERLDSLKRGKQDFMDRAESKPKSIQPYYKNEVEIAFGDKIRLLEWVLNE